jgi:hypothetical protein
MQNHLPGSVVFRAGFVPDAVAKVLKNQGFRFRTAWFSTVFDDILRIPTRAAGSRCLLFRNADYMGNKRKIKFAMNNFVFNKVL